VLVVDDGSTDCTTDVAAQFGAIIVGFPRNVGKGAALRAGWQRAREHGFLWVLNLDGDGQHHPEDIPVFLRRADETGSAMIVGNRMHSPREIPWVRRMVNCWMSQRLSIRAKQYLPDSQCGFRLVNLDSLVDLHLSSDRFEIESEMLLAFIRAGHRVEFVPVTVIGRGAHSHIRPVHDTLRWLRWWRRDRHIKQSKITDHLSPCLKP